MKKKDNLKEQIAQLHSLKIGKNELPLYEMNPTIVIANTHNFQAKAKGGMDVASEALAGVRLQVAPRLSRQALSLQWEQ